jgi:hypothetical protein
MAESGGEEAHLLLLIIKAQMNAIKALIERMGQAPEEFANEGSTRHTRWGHITDQIYEEDTTKPHVFTQEEINAYLDSLSKIIRAQIEEQICIEILNPLRSDTPQQMELFPAQTAYPPGSPKKLLVRADMAGQALKILEEQLQEKLFK